MARPLSLSLFVKSLACLSGFQGINAAVCALRATSPFCDTASRDQRFFLLRLDADLIAELARIGDVFLRARGEFLGAHARRRRAPWGSERRRAISFATRLRIASGVAAGANTPNQSSLS